MTRCRHVDFQGYEGPRHAIEPWTDESHPLYLVLPGGDLRQVLTSPDGIVHLGPTVRDSHMTDATGVLVDGPPTTTS